MKTMVSGFKACFMLLLLAAFMAGCGKEATSNQTSKPIAPTGLSATAENAQVQISWTAATDATSYNIYWSTTTGVTKTNGTKITGATSPYTHASLTNDTTYYYIVTAVNSSGESVESSQVSATPSLFSGTYTGSWSLTCPGCGDTAAGTFTTTVANGVFTNTTFSITTGTHGIKFDSGTVSSSGAITGAGATPSQCSSSASTFTGQITITSTGGADMTMTYSRDRSPEGCEAESGTITATRTTTASAPSAPTGVSATAGDSQVTISWAGSTNATSYNIYYSTTSGVTKTTGTKITGATSPYTHTGLTNGTAYYYVVTAVNGNGESSESSKVNGTPASTSSGTWTTKTSMSMARGGAAGGVVNGLLYVVGGGPPTGYATTLTEVYDPMTDVWTAKASAPTSRAGATGGVINGKLYVVGGCIDSDCIPGNTNILEVYDPITNSWTTKTPMSTARNNMASGVIDGKLYVVGGMQQCGPCTSLATLEVYNPTTDTWITKASMSTARSSPAARVINGQLYVIGGIDRPSSTSLATLEVYNPTTDTWITKASMSTARSSPGAGVINGQLYVVGGANSNSYLTTVEVYDPTANTWSTKASMPTARDNLVSDVVNGMLYAVGGSNGGSQNNGQLSTNEAYTP